MLPSCPMTGLVLSCTCLHLHNDINLQSSTAKKIALYKQILKTAMQPTEPQLEEPKDSDVEPSSEQMLNEQPEPTVTFLFTLLNTPEPRDEETDTEILENQFVDQDDWGPRRTSEEIQLLQMDCNRLQEALYANQRENLILEEKLENLPTLLYGDLENILISPEESRVTQDTDKNTQGQAEDIYEEAEDIHEEAEDIQEEAGVTQEEVQPLAQPKSVSGPRYSFDVSIPLPASSVFPEDSYRNAPPVSPSLSPSNKDPH